MSEPTLAEVMDELAALEDPRMREVNEKHGPACSPGRPRVPLPSECS